MQRKCLKCDHVHPEATGDELEACPQCGAIYSRVAAALAAPKGRHRSGPNAANAEVLAAAKDIELQNKKMLQECWRYLFLLGFMGFIWLLFKSIGGSSPQPPVTPRVETAVVSNSAWDGSVWQVERYLKKHLKDPSSLDVMEWGHVVSDSAGFVVRVKYRAKNSFGAFTIEHQVFQLDSQGAVLAVGSI